MGFWIDTKATPARISLGTITILAMGSFLIGEQDGFPSVSYIRAIDIYLITCFVFVFGCMVEYAFVHYAKRIVENREIHKESDTEVRSSLSISSNVGNDVEGFSLGYCLVCKPSSLAITATRAAGEPRRPLGVWET